MNELEQFRSFLSSLELGDNKENILSTFDNVSKSVSGLVTDLKTNLADEREKTQPLKDKNKEFLSAVGLKDNATLEDVKEFMESINKKQGDVIPKDKYESDLNELRQTLQEKEALANDNLAKYEDLQFRINVEDKGLLKDFIDNPIIKKTMTDDLKAKLVFENGNAFIKDENGNIQKDIQTGEPLPVESLVESYKSSPLYKDFVKNPISASGSGVQESKTPAQQEDKKADTKEYKDSSSFIGDAFKSMENKL